MVSWSKCFILLIILSQVSVAAENIENNGLTIPIEDSKASDISISNVTNANFQIINTKSEAIGDALVIVMDSEGNKVVNISDPKGKTYVQVSPGQANISIEADGYEESNNNFVMISENATFTYVLNPGIDKTIWRDRIALMIPFFIMLLFSLAEWPERNYHWYAYLPIVLWAISFAILINSADDANYTIFFFDPGLKVSLFIPIAAFLGAASAITVGILNKLEMKPLNSAWKNIYFAYGRRLLMAPYIAIIALFTITGVGDINNKGGVLFFAYFVGLYTKQIEGTLSEIGRKFLTEKQITELNERESEAFDLVKRLGVSANVFDRLSKQGIKNIGDLVAITNTKIDDAATKAEVTEDYLRDLRTKAIKQDTEIKEMKEKLGLDNELITMLIDAGFYSMNELSRIDSINLSEITTNIGISNSKSLEVIIQRAKEEMNHWYLFSWDKTEEITENDKVRLIEYLKQNFGIDWVKAENIIKNNDKTIQVSTEKNKLSLKLNDEKTEVSLEIDDGRTDKLIVKKQNDTLNIYGHLN